jgi:hypothetical protein
VCFFCCTTEYQNIFKKVFFSFFGQKQIFFGFYWGCFSIELLIWKFRKIFIYCKSSDYGLIVIWAPKHMFKKDSRGGALLPTSAKTAFFGILAIL